MNIAVVAVRFKEDVYRRLLRGALNALEENGIQDRDAYRLFFLSASAMPGASGEEVHHQKAVLTDARLKDTEIVSATNILNDFGLRYKELIDSYNAQATRDGSADMKTFLSQRDALVQATKDKLESVLSPLSAAFFHSHIQSEKSKMKVAM
jgi:hypothetical protein